MDYMNKLGQGTLSQGPAPTGRDKLFDALYNALGGTPDKRWYADKAATALDWGTLGMLTGAYDGGRELAETGRPAALAMALMPGAKGVRAAGQAAQEAAKTGIRALHVSPHNFDRFDGSKVGSGIGATTEGHGLYFTTSPKLVDEYAAGIENPSRYEVRINADPSKFLDYDELVQSGLHETASTPAFAAQAKAMGIPGIRAKNTGAGFEGTENYTVFDDALIEILRKYGVLPPAVGGAAMAAQPGDASAQGMMP